MLNFLMPDAQRISNHPIYTIEARHHRRLGYLFRLRIYSLMWFLRVFAALFALWVGAILLTRQDYYYNPYDDASALIAWVALGALAAGLVLDFASIAVSINGIRKERLTGHWNLISLTTLKRQDIIIAKHTLAQMRIWRFTIIISSVRLAVVILFVLQMILISVEQSSFGVSDSPFNTITVALIILIVYILYVVEPLWRMRAVTAIGTWLSSRLLNLNIAFLAGFAAVVFMWIIQGMIVFAYFWVVGRLSEGLWRSSEFVQSSTILFFVLAFAMIVYTYYRIVSRVCLWRALRYGFE